MVSVPYKVGDDDGRIMEVSDYGGVGLWRCRMMEVSDDGGVGLQRSHCMYNPIRVY